MNMNNETARLELTAFFEKTAHDLIPLIVDSILKPPPPPPPPPPVLETVVVAYPLPEIGTIATFPPPPGVGWKMTSLDTNSGDRILGLWTRQQFAAIDAEFADDDDAPKTDAPPDGGSGAPSTDRPPAVVSGIAGPPASAYPGYSGGGTPVAT